MSQKILSSLGENFFDEQTFQEFQNQSENIGNGGIHLGINYSVSNETKRDE